LGGKDGRGKREDGGMWRLLICEGVLLMVMVIIMMMHGMVIA
jgi:hypothetical protein